MFDILIQGATIIDGTGSPGWIGDVAIKDKRIKAVAGKIDGQAARRLSAKGQVVSPGFIDLHGHSDIHLLDHPDAQIKLRQGVTLDTAGNCGFSVAPLSSNSGEAVLNNCLTVLGKPSQPIKWLSWADYADTMQARGLSTNMTLLVGHGTVRTLVMGFSNQQPNPEQLGRMKDILGEALDQGALGMSTGLIYLPGCYSKTHELVELSKVIAQKGGIYTSHTRNESTDVLSSIEEAVTIAREADVPVQISHLKISGSQNWHLADKVVAILEQARAQGLDVTCDVYPYVRASTTLLAVLPPWALEGGVPAIMARLGDSTQRKRIIADMKASLPGWHNFYIDSDWDNITIASLQGDQNQSYEGQTISALAASKKQDPFDFALDLLLAEECGVFCVYELMNEETVARFISLPFAMVGSDGVPNGSKPHPRLYGTFPRIIARYVRELKILSLEEAIKKMTFLPAQRLGLSDRGVIKPGNWADLVLFDPKEFTDTATYSDPCQYPRGLNTVMVNGEVVIDGPTHTGATPGIFERRRM